MSFFMDGLVQRDMRTGSELVDGVDFLPTVGVMVCRSDARCCNYVGVGNGLGFWWQMARFKVALCRSGD